MKMITGRTGEKHVRAMDDARVVRLLLGSEDYIMPDGLQLSAEIDQSNPTLVHVYNGYLVMQGRQAGIDASDVEETVTLSPGIMGQNRIDIIFAEYKIDDDGIESVELRVVTGESTSSDEPVEPSLDYEDGDIDSGSVHQMKLHRVRWTGYSPTIERVIEPVDVVPFDRAVAAAEAVETAATNAIARIEAEVESVQPRIQGHWAITSDDNWQIGTYSDYDYTIRHLISSEEYTEYQETDIFTVFINGIKVSSYGRGANNRDAYVYVRELIDNDQFDRTGKVWLIINTSGSVPYITFIFDGSLADIDTTHGIPGALIDEVTVEVWR